MAEREFFNVGQYTAYPLVAQDQPVLLAPTVPPSFSSSSSASLGPIGAANQVLPREGLVDAGFMLGPSSGFMTAVNNVFLEAISIWSTEVWFEFTSNAPGMTHHLWRFVVSKTAKYGITVQADVHSRITGHATPDFGWGFITLGHLGELLTLADGYYALVSPWKVEPALLQNLSGVVVNSLIVANDERTCPPACCGAWATPPDPPVAYVAPGGAGLQGDVKFKEGFNAPLAIILSENALRIGGALGQGAGNTCQDIRVLADGLHKDPSDLGAAFCEACNQYIRSINGQNFNNSQGKASLSFPAGAVIIPEPSLHRIRIRLKSYASSSSSSA